MCYAPIRILNPSRSYRSDVPKYLFVPCGHCQDCQRTKHNEWFFRALIEWNYYRSIGGAVYFITLTYNDNDLPKHTLSNCETITCFNSVHIHNFIKYLRIFLARSNLEHKDIKYLICSEYSDKNSKRPHYHGLLFFPYHLPCLGSQSLFTRLMQRCWQHGFIVCSRFGWEIDSVKGIRYATKYVCKDIGYYKDNIQSYLNVLDVDERDRRKKELSPFLPRHWQSVGFGSPFLDVIKSHSDIASYLFEDSFTLNFDKNPSFRIPRYYHLKLEKNIARDLSNLLDKVVQVTTPIGKDVKRMRLNKMLDSSVVRLRDMCSLLHLETLFPSESEFLESVQWFRKRYPLRYAFIGRFESYEFTRSCTIGYIHKHINNIDLRKLACYQLFLRHLPLFDDDVVTDMFDRVPDVMENMVDSPNVPPEIAELGLCSDADFLATPLKDDEVARKRKMCKDNEYFKPYELLCISMDMLTDIRNVCRDYSSWYKQEQKKNVRAWKPNKPITYQSNEFVS